ncbi:hypothetical protein C8R45DRAFT_1090775 [Mycena sanguinolenta]|nr:hypothetical protein C8R45DRAFT_1090775 [Mycena sanguinolenta]
MKNYSKTHQKTGIPEPDALTVRVAAAAFLNLYRERRYGWARDAFVVPDFRVQRRGIRSHHQNAGGGGGKEAGWLCRTEAAIIDGTHSLPTALTTISSFIRLLLSSRLCLVLLMWLTLLTFFLLVHNALPPAVSVDAVARPLRALMLISASLQPLYRKLLSYISMLRQHVAFVAHPSHVHAASLRLPPLTRLIRCSHRRSVSGLPITTSRCALALALALALGASISPAQALAFDTSCFIFYIAYFIRCIALFP